VVSRGGAAGGAGTGGVVATGGRSGGGAGGSAGTGGTGGASGDHWGGPKNPPEKSAGCGKAATLTNGKKTITSSGRQRAYIIDIPNNYDSNKPYRLFYASHGLGGKAEDVAGWNYFGLKTQATAANEPAIFIAPQAIDRWDETDHALFDDITALAKDGLCIDTTRIFVTGMSFGGMITYSLSTNHQKRFRAGVGLAPANYNIWLPNPKLKEPIAWMQTTGMNDMTCPWDSGNNRGSKYIALEKAADNGCTVPTTIPTWKQGDPSRHICVDLEGCKVGYPVKVCTFNGDHWQFPYDDGDRENLAKSWVPVESWKFFTQF
jgi:poly(3-hydroxybutyrate) depolymerase